jgi:hypothetical protein
MPTAAEVVKMLRHLTQPLSDKAMNQFLSDRCIISDELEELTSYLYRDYRVWCILADIEFVSPDSFHRALRTLFVVKKDRSLNANYYKGVALKP